MIAEWDFWDAFTFDFGVRYNYERRGIDYTLFSVVPSIRTEDFTGEEPTGTVRLTWRPNEESSLYMKYTHGWKSGTFNASGSRVRGVAPAKPESIDSFEVGLRGSYFDDRVHLLVSLFYYDYADYQLFTPILEQQQPVQFVIKNASDVELFGSEIELTLAPWEGTTFDVKFAWLRGEFLDFVTFERRSRQVGATRVDIVTAVDFSGNTLLNAPRYSVTLSATQGIPLGRFGALLVRWDGTWKDITYFDASEGRGSPNRFLDLVLPEETIAQRSFWLHNLRLAYYSPTETIEVAFWVRNLENTTYKAFAADLTAFVNTTLYFVSEPRTYGVTTSIRF
jgi:iron complex outermembrane receptor protein